MSDFRFTRGGFHCSGAEEETRSFRYRWTALPELLVLLYEPKDSAAHLHSSTSESLEPFVSTQGNTDPK